MPYFVDASPGPLVILMRHGPTMANEGGDPLIRAWKNYDLDPDHEDMVIKTADKLADYQPGYIVSSDLARDTATAKLVANELDISNWETDWDARTWDMGSLEGQPLEDVNEAVEQLMKRPWEMPPGSSETFNTFLMRWQKFLDRKMYMATNIPGTRPALIVTHGKCIAASESYIDGTPAWECEMPLPAGYAVVSVNLDRSLKIEMMGKVEPVIEDV